MSTPVPGTLPTTPAVRPVVGKKVPTFDFASFQPRRNQKRSILWFGDKGVGKTVEMLSAEGRHLVFSLDNQSQGVVDGFYHGDRNIWVMDPLQFFRDALPDEVPWAAKVTVDWILEGMERVAAKFHPHWIDFDGLEMLNTLADQTMRYGHRLKMSQGFKELSWWKDRWAVLRALWRSSQLLALVGTQMTAYYAGNFGEEGSLHSPQKVPKWIAVFKEETEIAVEVRSTYVPLLKKPTYSAYVLTSKPHTQDILPTGATFDISDGQTVPFGPGMAAALERADRAMQGVAIEYPELSNTPSETASVLPPYEAAPAGRGMVEDVPSDTLDVAPPPLVTNPSRPPAPSVPLGTTEI